MLFCSFLPSFVTFNKAKVISVRRFGSSHFGIFVDSYKARVWDCGMKIEMVMREECLGRRV